MKFCNGEEQCNRVYNTLREGDLSALLLIKVWLSECSKIRPQDSNFFLYNTVVKYNVQLHFKGFHSPVTQTALKTFQKQIGNSGRDGGRGGGICWTDGTWFHGIEMVPIWSHLSAFFSLSLFILPIDVFLKRPCHEIVSPWHKTIVIFSLWVSI